MPFDLMANVNLDKCQPRVNLCQPQIRLQARCTKGFDNLSTYLRKNVLYKKKKCLRILRCPPWSRSKRSSFPPLLGKKSPRKAAVSYKNSTSSEKISQKVWWFQKKVVLLQPQSRRLPCCWKCFNSSVG